MFLFTAIGNILILQPGLNACNSTPWLILLVLIHIALHPRLIHLKVLELLHGWLDIEAFLAMLNLLHSDPSDPSGLLPFTGIDAPQ